MPGSTVKSVVPRARLSYPARFGHCKAEEFVTRRWLYVLALLVAGSDIARAQIIRPVFRNDPQAWTSLSIGWFQQQGFNDRDTGAGLDFGSGPQWRASLEVPMGMGGTTIGAVGTIAKMPLVYRGSVLAANSCAGCDANATISQIFGTLRMGGGAGFHQVIDLGAGTTMFSNFRREDTGAKLGTGKTTSNFTFALGYGFEYGLSSRTQINLVQEYALIILPREAGSSNNTSQQRTLRIGFRYGLGSKSNY
jgi:opacity protein-like surface antigen